MTALEQEISRIIRFEGPISLERFMGLALGHPKHGYYMTRDPFGAQGDFVTAPEISQMFGELIGLWAAEIWAAMGRPSRVILVELGPGRGTLMADALRALRAAPSFLSAIEVHMVEMSPVLSELQRQSLERSSVPVFWHKQLNDVPEGPTILLANEFFDALPVRQYVNTQRGWCERLVGLDEQGQLMFGVSSTAESTLKVAAPLGEILEIGAQGQLMMREIGQRLQRQHGAALIVDYGYAETALGETFQALKNHEFVHPLSSVGEADLTVHVDFSALMRAANSVRLNVFGPVYQGDFLLALGIEQRAEALKRRATEAQIAEIDAATLRLTDESSQNMGHLFKVLAVTSPDLKQIPGFPQEFA